MRVATLNLFSLIEFLYVCVVTFISFFSLMENCFNWFVLIKLHLFTYRYLLPAKKLFRFQLQIWSLDNSSLSRWRLSRRGTAAPPSLPPSDLPSFKGTLLKHKFLEDLPLLHLYCNSQSLTPPLLCVSSTSLSISVLLINNQSTGAKARGAGPSVTIQRERGGSVREEENGKGGR